MKIRDAVTVVPASLWDFQAFEQSSKTLKTESIKKTIKNLKNNIKID